MESSGLTLRSCFSRNGVTFAEGKSIPREASSCSASAPLRPPTPGRYKLTVAQHLDGQRVVTKSSIRLG